MAFYEAIAELDPQLAGWYYGARVALSDLDNPEAFAQAGHSIRELMNNLHTIVDVPAESVDTRRMGDVFNTLADRWEGGQKNSACFVDGQWSGTIDRPATKAFVAVDEAVTWYRENRPKRRETVRTTLRGLGGSRLPVPTWVEDKHIELWDELRDFFIRVCHHGQETDATEFLGAVAEFELFVLGRLQRRTFDQHDTLDELISEVEDG